MGFRCLHCHQKCHNAEWGTPFKCQNCESIYEMVFDWEAGGGKILRAEGPHGEDLLGTGNE